MDGQLWKSVDRGDTWTPVGPKLPTDFAASSVAFAPSDPRVVYLAGSIVENGGTRLLRSVDGGSSWSTSSIPVARTDTWDPRIGAIDPANPDTVILRVDAIEGYGQDTPDEVWGTMDGGRTWKALYTGSGDIPGITIDPATKTLFLAGPLEGVQAAPLDAAFSTGKTAFSRTFDGMAFGLRWTEDGLLVGGNNYPPRGVPAYMLGQSTDQGNTFSRLMTVCDLGLAACDANTTVGSRCPAIWNDTEISRGFATEYIAPRCSSGPDAGSADAGSAGAGTSSGGAGNNDTGGASGGGPKRDRISSDRAGCGCTTPASPLAPGRDIALMLGAVGVAVAARLRLRRRSSSTFPGCHPEAGCTPATRRACGVFLPTASDRTGA
jgi:MYXO-CTERM domain-containing protein